jgi:tetratricopeptide (TPR) repeat protein
VQASVDWMHLLPGLTGAAVIGGAAVLARGPNAPRRPHPTGVTVTGAIVGAAVVVVAMTSLSRQLLADFYRARGQTQLATAPAQALHSANRSLRVDGDATATYYLKAAALARFGAADAAEATLNAAIAREPGNFLSYALLGDLLTRRGRRHDAHTAYATALRLNPRDPALRALVRTPLERSTRQG